MPIPTSTFDSVVMIPGSIASVRGDMGAIIFTRIDTTSYFEDLAQVPEFSEYAKRGRDAVEWLYRGLSLTSEDISCRRESIPEDVINVIDALSTGVIALIDEETRVMRVDGDVPALVFGEPSSARKRIRIEYIFQNPTEGRVELLHLDYHLEGYATPIDAMNEPAASLEQKESQPGKGLSEIVRAILDNEYDEAASLAESNGLSVQVGLP